MGRLFGTDGARGVANTELTCELAMKIGRAAALVLNEEKIIRPRVLIGMDTRASSDMLEAAIAAGLCSVGADVFLLGVVPTPAVAYLVKRYNCDAGIMISASHNPGEYNGIKIFQADGYKLPDALEDEIEAIILDETVVPDVKIGGEVGRVSDIGTAVSDYIDHLISTVDISLDGIDVAFDCANGSASATAARLFPRLGVNCSFIACEPDGTNINRACGSTDLSMLGEYVVSNGLSAGFAFDGDADRVLAVDENGAVVDGDKILAICAESMKNEGRLAAGTVVMTVMSNMGLHRFCRERQIGFECTQVGDRYVLERMLENGYRLGGEQSGHVIFLDYATTGDGQLTALQVLRVMKKSGKPLSALAADIRSYPQIMINIKVSAIGKKRFSADEEVRLAVEKAQSALGSRGRVVVRVSGTEPLVRVMLEGEDAAEIEELGNEIADVIRERLL